MPCGYTLQVRHGHSQQRSGHSTNKPPPCNSAVATKQAQQAQALPAQLAEGLVCLYIRSDTGLGLHQGAMNDQAHDFAQHIQSGPPPLAAPMNHSFAAELA